MKTIYVVTAPWCAPCKALIQNVIDPLKQKVADPDQIRVVDGSRNYSFCRYHHINRTPTVIFRDGDEWRKMDPIPTMEEMRKWLHDPD